VTEKAGVLQTLKDARAVYERRKKVPGDPLDDVADACRYGVFNWFTASEKPPEIIMREKRWALILIARISVACRQQQKTPQVADDRQRWAA